MLHAFLLVDPQRSHLARQFIEQLGPQGTTVLVGAAEVSWTVVLWNVMKRMCASWLTKLFHDGVPDDMSVQSLFDKTTSAKNMMSRIRGYSPSQWVLATQPRIPESHMIDDEDEDYVPHKDIPESQEDVVGVLTLFGGVMQVFHELLVGLRLLLLHEEEEKEEKQGRQEDREVESGEDQGEETAHMDDMWMG